MVLEFEGLRIFRVSFPAEPHSPHVGYVGTYLPVGCVSPRMLQREVVSHALE